MKRIDISFGMLMSFLVSLLIVVVFKEPFLPLLGITVVVALIYSKNM